MKRLRTYSLAFVSVMAFAFSFVATSENVEAIPPVCCTMQCSCGPGSQGGHFEEGFPFCHQGGDPALSNMCDWNRTCN